MFGTSDAVVDGRRRGGAAQRMSSCCAIDAKLFLNPLQGRVVAGRGRQWLPVVTSTVADAPTVAGANGAGTTDGSGRGRLRHFGGKLARRDVRGEQVHRGPSLPSSCRKVIFTPNSLRNAPATCVRNKRVEPEF